MFDIGWSELLVIGVVALIAIGPKELPGVLRAMGHWMGKVRRMASDFQDQFREAMALLESSPDLRSALGANGRKFYRQHYRWEVIEGKYDRILQALVREDQTRAPEPRPGLLAKLFRQT